MAGRQSIMGASADATQAKCTHRGAGEGGERAPSSPARDDDVLIAAAPPPVLLTCSSAVTPPPLRY
jgi:hypothetical protein